MLSVGGVLDPRMFGPGSLDDGQPRRSIYFTVKRSKLVPMMTLFDAPDALSPIAVRSTTTNAPQALLIMNSPLVRQWAQGFARRAAPSPDVPLERVVRSAFLMALAREPDPGEINDSLAFFEGRAKANDPQARERALVDFCQAIFGLSEFINIE